MTNQSKILELKVEQLELQKKEIERKINNLLNLKNQLDSKIDRITEQRNRISQSENQNNFESVETKRSTDLGNSSIF